MNNIKSGIQLQEILKPRREICSVEELYFHRKDSVLLFDGYFNLFYIEKWKRYTNLEQLRLSIQAAGCRKLLLFHDRTCVSKYRLDAGCEKKYEAEFPLDEYDSGVFWFAVIKSEKDAEWKLSGFYTGGSSRYQDAAVGIDICTFHRERYVERNLKLLISVINKKYLQVSNHLWIYIVDNGRTLHECEPVKKAVKGSADRIRVVPNINAGGAGGFTRGMIEILQEKEEKKLTHVLLMDDDVWLEPDLLVRIYGFLRIRKEEWRNITLGGSMLQAEKPYLLFAAGERWQRGFILNRNKGLDLRCFHNVSYHELLTNSYEKKYYSGWWCCCYSLDVVREDNLPLPLFLHHDDIEFGLRNRQEGIVFLNGVSVWHRNLEHTPVGSNLYYDIRNALIEMALQYQGRNAARYLWRFYWKRLAVRLFKGRMGEARYVIRGAQDFLKGPEWLWRQDPQQLHEKIKKMPGCDRAGIRLSAVRICLKLFRERKKAVLDYQKNMYKYAQKISWMEYLGIEKKEGRVMGREVKTSAAGQAE